MQLLCWSVAVAAAAATLAYVPRDLRDVWRDVRNASAQTRLERQLAPARVVGLQETSIFLVARDVIPARSTYYVAVGEAAGRSAFDWVRPFATYWLLPRRRTDELGEAAWILAYGADLKALGLPYARVITIGPGLALAEVQR